MNTSSWIRVLKLFSCLALLLILFSCSDKVFSAVFFTIFGIGIVVFALITFIRTMIGSFHSKNKEGNDINSNPDSGNSCSTSGNSCSGGSSCGSGCGGGCGGCGGS